MTPHLDHSSGTRTRRFIYVIIGLLAVFAGAVVLNSRIRTSDKLRRRLPLNVPTDEQLAALRTYDLISTSRVQWNDMPTTVTVISLEEPLMIGAGKNDNVEDLKEEIVRVLSSRDMADNDMMMFNLSKSNWYKGGISQYIYEPASNNILASMAGMTTIEVEAGSIARGISEIIEQMDMFAYHGTRPVFVAMDAAGCSGLVLKGEDDEICVVMNWGIFEPQAYGKIQLNATHTVALKIINGVFDHIYSFPRGHFQTFEVDG